MQNVPYRKLVEPVSYFLEFRAKVMLLNVKNK